MFFFYKFTVGRELPGGRRASRLEGSFPRDGASQWEYSFPVVRDVPSGKAASKWEERFLLGRELPSGK